jgi:hypothetical protein
MRAVGYGRITNIVLDVLGAISKESNITRVEGIYE